MDFNPFDKIPELTEMLQAYNPIIHQKSDEGYNWLDENSFCIEIPSPNGGDSILIVYEGCGEFTICFSYFHSHYSANNWEYDEMCKKIFDLLDSKFGAASILYGSEKKCLASTLIEKEKTALSLEEIFPFVFNYGKYLEKMRNDGAEARFVFWDSNLNRIIKL